MAVFYDARGRTSGALCQGDGGQAVLDVGTGTGVVAITARNMGAKVTGLDLTPALLEQARENATLAGHDDIAWHEGDAERCLFRMSPSMWY